MSGTEQLGGAGMMIERLQAAVNAHDLTSLGACFAPEYVNETPAHPARGFRGREQVRKNWAQIFAALPDIRARLVRSAVDGDTVWSEWEMTGTRLDGSLQTMVGVTIFGVIDGAATWARFYLEPVDPAPLDVDGAIRRTMAPHAPVPDGLR